MEYLKICKTFYELLKMLKKSGELMKKLEQMPRMIQLSGVTQKILI